MTRSTNMEHVEVLRELRRFAVGKEIGALDAAIASLSAQQPPAEAQPVAYADPQAFANFKERGHLGGPHGREWMWAKPDAGLVPVYAHPPPSAPVGVEVKVLARDVHYAIRDAGLSPESPVDDAAMRDAILRTLAQQPSAELYRCTACDDHYRIGTPCDCKLQPGHPDFTPATQQPAQSAPLGVEVVALIANMAAYLRVKGGENASPLVAHADRLLAQQPAAVDEAMVFRIAAWMAKNGGHDDPHHLIWEGSPPEPWGEVWNLYEDDARAALALAAALAAQPGGSDNDR